MLTRTTLYIIPLIIYIVGSSQRLGQLQVPTILSGLSPCRVPDTDGCRCREPGTDAHQIEFVVLVFILGVGSVPQQKGAMS